MPCRRPRPRWLLLAVGLAWQLFGVGAANAQPAGGSPAGLDPRLVGATVGRDVARRWCAGEDPKRAIELALLSDLSGRRIAPADLPGATMQALGREISVEAFAQAFVSCPQTARQVFRSLIQ